MYCIYLENRCNGPDIGLLTHFLVLSAIVLKIEYVIDETSVFFPENLLKKTFILRFSPRSGDFFKENHAFFKLFAAKRRLFFRIIFKFFRCEAAFFF